MNIFDGDNILLHTNSAGLLQYINNKKVFEIFYNTLKKRVGTNGSIAVPAYNYNFTKKNILITLSQKAKWGF